MSPASRRTGTGATGAWIAAALVAVAVSACAGRQHEQPACRGDSSIPSILLLAAQAVPSATLIPCTLPLPGGWSHGGTRVRSGLARFWFNSDRAGTHAAEITLTATCDVAETTRLPSADEAGVQRYGLWRYEGSQARHPGATVRYFVFSGGCVTYRLAFTRQTAPALFDQANQFLAFTARSVYVSGVHKDSGLPLCGAEAPPCPG
jgi:hypothetical protein